MENRSDAKCRLLMLCVVIISIIVGNFYAFSNPEAVTESWEALSLSVCMYSLWVFVCISGTFLIIAFIIGLSIQIIKDIKLCLCKGGK